MCIIHRLVSQRIRVETIFSVELPKMKYAITRVYNELTLFLSPICLIPQVPVIAVQRDGLRIWQC